MRRFDQQYNRLDNRRTYALQYEEKGNYYIKKFSICLSLCKFNMFFNRFLLLLQKIFFIRSLKTTTLLF